MKQELLNAALKFATEKHAGEFDYGGKPYILHVLRVMQNTRSDDEEILCIAILHDVIEDTNATYHDLRNIGMTDRIVEGVRALTKIPGQTYDEYKIAVKSNPDAIVVKMADLEDNSDLRRLKGVTEKDLKRTVRYYSFYNELKGL